MNREELFEACFNKWGSSAQMLMAIEEMGELSQALARYLNHRENNLNEELADALLMLEQLQYLIGKDKIEAIQNKKMERIRERLELKKEE